MLRQVWAAPWCPMPGGDRRDTDGIFCFRSCLWLTLGLVWARSAVALGCVTSGYYRWLSAQLTLQSLSSFPALTCLHKTTCPVMLCRKSGNASYHVLTPHAPCPSFLKVSISSLVLTWVLSHHMVDWHQELMKITAWIQIWIQCGKSETVRSPAMTDMWPQKHSHSVGGKEVWYTSNQEQAGGRSAESPGAGFQCSSWISPLNQLILSWGDC